MGSEAEEDGDHDYDSDADEEKSPQDVSQLPFKVLVSHVCRRWRTVAVEIPTLWAHLDFAEGPPFDKSRIWLERSKGYPLDIELDCTVDDDDAGSDESDDQADASSDDELVAPEDRVAMPGGPAPRKESARRVPGRISPLDLPVVRDLILPHAARWRIFELMVNDFQIMYGILSTLASIPSAPQLQALQLYHYDDDEDYDHFSPAHLKQPFAPFCGRAPSLLHVALWGVHVDWETCAFLQGLEELELAYHAKDVRPPYEIFTRILRGSPDLHILTLCASGPAGSPEDWPTDVIELPSVKHLVLAFVEPSYVSALMKRLVFPNLASLALDFDPEDYSSFLEQLAGPPAPPVHHRSLCHNLIDLKISGMHCSAAALHTFFSALPNLASLNLNCYHLPRHFFDYLYPGLAKKEATTTTATTINAVEGEGEGEDGRTDELQCYLPKLETLTTSGVTGEEMRDLLTSRTVPPIRHVLMDSGADVADKEEDWLRAHVETFDFFECSDDEDDPMTSEDEDEDEEEDEDEDEEEEQVVDGEGDGVPGEWIDYDDPIE